MNTNDEVFILPAYKRLEIPRTSRELDLETVPNNNIIIRDFTT